MSSVSAIVLDIEGTTTSISFVHEVLFPLSAREIKDHVLKNHQSLPVKDALDLLWGNMHPLEKPPLEYSGPQLQLAVETLLSYIAEDKKDTALKILQGQIWKSAYEQGKVKSHLYDDVAAQLMRWHAQNIKLYIYSSGSVEAQQLLFKYTEAGDLTGILQGYFDTKIGGKKEEQSYIKIAREIHQDPGQILFLSDMQPEVAAASKAGWQVIRIIRPGTKPGSEFIEVADFISVANLIKIE